MLDFANNPWAFPVEAQPIFDRFGNEIDGNMAVVRTDTNKVLGVHGSRYNLVPHDDVVNAMLDAIKKADVSQDYTVDVKVIDEGRKVRGEILFNDLVAEPVKDDLIKFRLSLFSSYDGSWPVAQAADALRLWCTNGCVTPEHAAHSRFKHTNNINVVAAAEKVAKALEWFMKAPEQWKAWREHKVARDAVEDLFKRTLAKMPGKTSVQKVNNKQLEFLMSQYDKEVHELGQNKWAVYNTATYWSSHTGDTKNPEVTRRLREEAVTSMMNTNHWEMV